MQEPALQDVYDGDLIPLHQAVLCENCSVISQAKGETCPGCGSKSLLNLAKVLGREGVP